jgi:hypothetical protein
VTAPQRVGRSAWTASVARVPVDSATRLVWVAVDGDDIQLTAPVRPVAGT